MRFILLFLFAFSLNLSAQELYPGYLNWQNSDPEKDKTAGVSTQRVYDEFLKKGRTSKTIVVAVIDNGVDVKHEDLEGKIWINKGEVPGNGIDDDKNGYVDDVHGWNFLGAKDTSISAFSMELTRVFASLHPKYRDKNPEDEMSSSEKKEFQTYLECKEILGGKINAGKQNLAGIQGFLNQLNWAENTIRKQLKKDSFSIEEVASMDSTNHEVYEAKRILLVVHQRGLSLEMAEREAQISKRMLDVSLNPDYNPRETIGDDATTMEMIHYGNPDVGGGHPSHGTFVAGLIAAKRNNGIGINGIAEKAEIMVLRATPSEGDEYDKDVALSIRYAVDNGAQIINLSFGKNYSPQKLMVDKALEYADQHDVLVIHAAGNEGKDVDTNIRYPNPRYLNKGEAKNWINVGASSKNQDSMLVGEFSNYGLKNVHLFAPGVDVVSLYPDNEYQKSSGTSYASPVAAGVAALVWSYFPELKASELKEILLNSTTKYEDFEVIAPSRSSGKIEKVKLSQLSQTGGLVNAYKAFRLAEKGAKKRRKKNKADKK